MEDREERPDGEVIMAISLRLFLAPTVFLALTALQTESASASGPPGSHYRLDSNKGGTSYSATITTTGRGVWIAVHARQSYAGSNVVPSHGWSASHGQGVASGPAYNQAGSRTASGSVSTIARTWQNSAGEPYYETTSGRVYHLGGIDIGNASTGPSGWITVGMQQHPGTVPEALYVNGKLQSIVWVPIAANGGALHWGAPPSGNGNAAAQAPIVIDPHTVAANVLQHIALPDVRLHTNPSLGLVALPGWFWAEGYNGAPFGGAASVAGLTVAVQVQPTSYTWSFGDGATLVSQDLGQPYPTQSDIQHTYQYSSLHFPTGFPVHLTIQYAATYSVNGGPSQALASMTRTYAASYRVQEIQSVLTNR
jgi:hypothetical protein